MFPCSSVHNMHFLPLVEYIHMSLSIYSIAVCELLFLSFFLSLFISFFIYLRLVGWLSVVWWVFFAWIVPLITVMSNTDITLEHHAASVNK